jgi:single-strand DNA-binding protein
MSNNISFIGNIGNDPELKQVGQTDLLELNVANNMGFGDRRTTNWFRCSIWGKRAVSLQPILGKGKQVFVTGQLTLREYTNRDGEKRTSADVRVSDLEIISRPGDGQQSSESQGSYSSSNSNSSATSTPAASTPENDEDMPF